MRCVGGQGGQGKDVQRPSWKSWKRSQTAKPAPQNLNKRCHQGNCLEDCCHQLFSSSQYKSTFDYCALIFVESSLKLPNDVNSCKLVATQLTGAVNFYHYWLLCSWISCQQANLDEDQLKLIVRKCWSWLLESASGWVSDLHGYPATSLTPLTPHKPHPVDAKLLQQTLVTVVVGGGGSCDYA